MYSDAQMGDLGKFKLKKFGKKLKKRLKKVAKKALPIAAGLTTGVLAYKGTSKLLKKKKAKKQAIASGSSGGAAEIAVAAKQAGVAPEAVVQSVAPPAAPLFQSFTPQPSVFASPAESLFNPEPAGGASAAAPAEGEKDNTLLYVGLGAAALYFLSKRKAA